MQLSYMHRKNSIPNKLPSFYHSNSPLVVMGIWSIMPLEPVSIQQHHRRHV